MIQHGHRHQLEPPAKRMIERMIQASVYIAGIQVQSHYKCNQLAIGGEGIESEIIFIIAIH